MWWMCLLNLLCVLTCMIIVLHEFTCTIFVLDVFTYTTFTLLVFMYTIIYEYNNCFTSIYIYNICFACIYMFDICFTCFYLYNICITGVPASFAVLCGRTQGQWWTGNSQYVSLSVLITCQIHCPLLSYWHVSGAHLFSTHFWSIPCHIFRNKSHIFDFLYGVFANKI